LTLHETDFVVKKYWTENATPTFESLALATSAGTGDCGRSSFSPRGGFVGHYFFGAEYVQATNFYLLFLHKNVFK